MYSEEFYQIRYEHGVAFSALLVFLYTWIFNYSRDLHCEIRELVTVNSYKYGNQNLIIRQV